MDIEQLITNGLIKCDEQAKLARDEAERAERKLKQAGVRA